MIRRYLNRIILVISLYLVFPHAYGQVSQGTPGNSCVILRVDYCSNWITVSYGSNKTEETRLERSKQLPIKDQIGTINNILADTLNKLEKEGYRVASSVSDVNNGSTCGITFILYKNQ